jgi:hypothetical protein
MKNPSKDAESRPLCQEFWIQEVYNYQSLIYEADPLDKVMWKFASAPYSPSTGPMLNVITGQGDLVSVGSAPTCVTATTNVVWITNLTATVAANGTMGVTFSIEGGVDGAFYDVFANSLLSFGTNGVPWAWMGQGQHCNMYSLTNLPNTTCFLILGTPQDSSDSGLTDAYQLLVSKTNPYVTNSDLDGIPTGWEILLGLNPTICNFASPSQRSILATRQRTG